MYAVCVTFRIKPAQMRAFMPEMLANAAASLAREEGCHQFDVCCDGNEVFLYELYDDREAFDTHLRMTHFVEFDQLVQPMIEEKAVKTYSLVKLVDAL